jgi:hypothetical protein
MSFACVFDSKQARVNERNLRQVQIIKIILDNFIRISYERRRNVESSLKRVYREIICTAIRKPESDERIF